MISPVELLEIAVEVAARAAARHHAGGVGSVTTKSTRTDPVTEVDQQSERIITDALRELRPDDAVLGEEGGATPGSSGVRWIVDPLDGTVNYLYGYPSHAVSVGVEHDGELVAGVVHDTALGIVYAAARGQGATRDGRPISVTDVTDSGSALLATGFGYDPDLRRRQGAVLAAVLPEVRDIRRVGSAAVDLCFTACGAVDGYYEVGPNLWDVAAGLVIVREAGGVATYDAGAARVLAAGPRLHPVLDELIGAAESAS